MGQKAGATTRQTCASSASSSDHGLPDQCDNISKARHSGTECVSHNGSDEIMSSGAF